MEARIYGWVEVAALCMSATFALNKMRLYSRRGSDGRNTVDTNRDFTDGIICGTLVRCYCCLFMRQVSYDVNQFYYSRHCIFDCNFIVRQLFKDSY